MTRLWLDDERSIPSDFTVAGEFVFRAKTADQAIRLLKEGSFTVASLDHDLGDHATSKRKERTGVTVIEWMIENEEWPGQIIVHSWNPVGAKKMCDMINRYGPYERLIRPTPALAAPFSTREN